MSDRDVVITLTADTTAGQVVPEIHGQYTVSVQGDFGGGTLTHFIFNKKGRGAAARTATTVAENYESHVQESEFVLTGSTAPDLDIILTPITVNQD